MRPKYPVKLRDPQGKLHDYCELVEVSEAHHVEMGWGNIRAAAVPSYINDVKLLNKLLVDIRNLGHRYKGQGIQEAIRLVKEAEAQRFIS